MRRFMQAMDAHAVETGVKPQETASTREVYLAEHVFHDVDVSVTARRPRSEATPGAAPWPPATNRDVHPLLTKKIIAQ